MSIQQSINQALGVGALLASQTDIFKNAQEARTAKKAVAGVESAMRREDLKPEAERSTKRYELLHEQLTALGHRYPHVDMPNMPGISDELQKRYKQVNDNIYQKWQNAEQEANIDLAVKSQSLQKGRSKMGFETRQSMILDQYANPLEVKNER